MSTTATVVMTAITAPALAFSNQCTPLRIRPMRLTLMSSSLTDRHTTPKIAAAANSPDNVSGAYRSQRQSSRARTSPVSTGAADRGCGRRCGRVGAVQQDPAQPVGLSAGDRVELHGLVALVVVLSGADPHRRHAEQPVTEP